MPASKFKIKISKAKRSPQDSVSPKVRIVNSSSNYSERKKASLMLYLSHLPSKNRQLTMKKSPRGTLFDAYEEPRASKILDFKENQTLKEAVSNAI